jgi:hypothetical protein
LTFATLDALHTGFLFHEPAAACEQYCMAMHAHAGNHEADIYFDYGWAQSISFRGALFHRVMTGQPGFRMDQIMCDVVHPNALGHRRALCP